MTDAPTWPQELYTLLRGADVTQFAYVPDAGHRVLIDNALADPDVHAVALTTEEEGVAMLAGADLGRQGRAADAVVGGGQLHQHAVAQQGREFSAADADFDARGFRRGESLAVSDGPGDEAGAGGDGGDRAAVRFPGRT
jgi:hypothetical protein